MHELRLLLCVCSLTHARTHALARSLAQQKRSGGKSAKKECDEWRNTALDVIGQEVLNLGTSCRLLGLCNFLPLLCVSPIALTVLLQRSIKGAMISSKMIVLPTSQHHFLSAIIRLRKLLILPTPLNGNMHSVGGEKAERSLAETHLPMSEMSLDLSRMR